MVMITVRIRFKRLRPKMPAMASPASHRIPRVLNLRDVLRIDHLGHLVHLPRRRLLRLRVVCIIQSRPPIRPNILRICRMAGRTVCAQLVLPLVHNLVHLFARQVLRQNLQVRRCRSRPVRWSLSCGRLLSRIHLRGRGSKNRRCGHHHGGCGKQIRSQFQGGNSSRRSLEST